MNTWQEYYQNTQNRPPSKLLVEAVGFLDSKHKALDLGSGSLVDSKYLLSLGFDVVAVDKEPAPEQIIDPRFRFEQKLFRDYDFPENNFDLVNAQFSLPFHGKENFDLLVTKILNSLSPNGVFVGQLFGLRDEWNTPHSELFFCSKEKVEELFKSTQIIKLEEVDKLGRLAHGQIKQWHYYNVIAKKK